MLQALGPLRACLGVLSFMRLQIIRGLALGLAFIMYGREEGAETLIEQLTRDQDPILRYSSSLEPSPDMPSTCTHLY